MRSLIRDAVPESAWSGSWRACAKRARISASGRTSCASSATPSACCRPSFKEEVLLAALEALAQSRTLQASYRDGAGKLSRPELHPQAPPARPAPLPVRPQERRGHAAAHVRAASLHLGQGRRGPGPAGRGFRLQDAVRKGQADFAGDGAVQLELRVRGYVADLLWDCRLSADQTIEDEPEGSPFSARIRATVPETGQSLRWLLGCGANVEVLAPAKWREVVVSQLEKMGAIYGTSAPG